MKSNNHRYKMASVYYITAQGPQTTISQLPPLSGQAALHLSNSSCSQVPNGATGWNWQNNYPPLKSGLQYFSASTGTTAYYTPGASQKQCLVGQGYYLPNASSAQNEQYYVSIGGNQPQNFQAKGAPNQSVQACPAYCQASDYFISGSNCQQIYYNASNQSPGLSFESPGQNWRAGNGYSGSGTLPAGFFDEQIACYCAANTNIQALISKSGTSYDNCAPTNQYNQSVPNQFTSWPNQQQAQSWYQTQLNYFATQTYSNTLQAAGISGVTVTWEPTLPTFFAQYYPAGSLQLQSQIMQIFNILITIPMSSTIQLSQTPYNQLNSDTIISLAQWASTYGLASSDENAVYAAMTFLTDPAFNNLSYNTQAITTNVLGFCGGGKLSTPSTGTQPATWSPGSVPIPLSNPQYGYFCSCNNSSPTLQNNTFNNVLVANGLSPSQAPYSTSQPNCTFAVCGAQGFVTRSQLQAMQQNGGCGNVTIQTCNNTLDMSGNTNSSASGISQSCVFNSNTTTSTAGATAISSSSNISSANTLPTGATAQAFNTDYSSQPSTSQPQSIQQQQQQTKQQPNIPPPVQSSTTNNQNMVIFIIFFILIIGAAALYFILEPLQKRKKQMKTIVEEKIIEEDLNQYNTIFDTGFE